MPASQIIKFSFPIEDISAITDRIEHAGDRCHGASGGQRPAPRIAPVFYHRIPGSVNDGHDVALKVVDVAIHGSVVFNKGRPGLRIVEEMEFLGSFISINAGHDVALKVVDVAVHGSVVFNKGRPGLRIVEEMEFLGNFISINDGHDVALKVVDVAVNLSLSAALSFISS